MSSLETKEVEKKMNQVATKNKKKSRNGTKSKLSCPDCGKVVKKMKYHIQTIHGPPDLKRFICGICEKRFLLKEKLEAHKKVHSEEKEFAC